MYSKSGIVTDQSTAQIPVAGAQVYVLDGNRNLLPLYDAEGNALDNPLTTDVFGAYSYYSMSAGQFLHRYRFGGRDRYLEQVTLGPLIAAVNPSPESAGLFIAYDALGNPTASSGTGADAGLRTDLAAPTGASLTGFRQDGTNTANRDTAGKLKEVVSILDYIPASEHAAIKAETSTYDCGPAFNQAIADSLTVLVPQGLYQVGQTIREATNGGARNIIGQNRLKSKIVANATLAASGAPIIWLGNSNGHGNYRGRVQHLYLDGGDATAGAPGGAIGIRAHECGTSIFGDLYIKNCVIGIQPVGVISTSYGGEKTEFYNCADGILAEVPVAGTPSSIDDITTTGSPIAIHDNINHAKNLWFSGVSRPITIKGGLTNFDHIVLQGCGRGSTDDLITLLNANESFDYGAGPSLTNLWCEGGNYRSIVRVDTTRQATISRAFLSGPGANGEQGIIVTGSPGCHINDVSARGGWTRTPSEGRGGNYWLYVGPNSKNGFFGPFYFTPSGNSYFIDRSSAGHNHVIIDNHTNSNVSNGLVVGPIQISANVSGGYYIQKDTNAPSTNLYISGFQIAGTLRAAAIPAGTGIFNADTEFRTNNVRVVGARKTGWATATGTATRTTFDTASVTLPQLAEHVKALIDDLHATAGHGLIGT